MNDDERRQHAEDVRSLEADIAALEAKLSERLGMTKASGGPSLSEIALTLADPNFQPTPFRVVPMAFAREPMDSLALFERLSIDAVVTVERVYQGDQKRQAFRVHALKSGTNYGSSVCGTDRNSLKMAIFRAALLFYGVVRAREMPI